MGQGKALYNRWRPRTFAEVVGQEHVTRTLRNALTNGQLAHAYLFCGPRGTGKTSVARILARAANCKQGVQSEPCNRCENCRALLEDTQLDLLIEIDGASNTGVDSVRELRENVYKRPGGGDLTGRYKVYIIDEVHMLSTSAFNALLKTLEEPPPHVIFMFATTDPERIPATVLSRCQRFDLRPVALPELIRHLQAVAGDEGVEVEPRALELIARAATGSIRDSLSLLEQAMAFCGRTVTLAKVQAMLGLTPQEMVTGLVDGVLSRDLHRGLTLIQEVVARGVDLRQLDRQVVQFLRLLLLEKSGVAQEAALGEDAADAVRVRRDRITMAHLLRAIRLFAQAESSLRAPGVQPQLPLELAFVEAILDDLPPEAAERESETPVRRPVTTAREGLGERGHEPVQDRAAADGRVGEGRAAGAPPTAPQELTHAPGTRPASVHLPDPAPNVEDAGQRQPPEQGLADTTQRPPLSGAARLAPPGSPAALAGMRGSVGDHEAVALGRVVGEWGRLLDQLRGRSKMLVATLRDCRPVGIEGGDTVVIACRFSIHQQKLEDAQNRVVVEQELTRVLGSPCRIRCVVEDTGQPRGERTRRAAPMEDPVVKAALKIFNARILDEAAGVVDSPAGEV